MNKNELLKIMPENLKKYKNLQASAQTMVRFFEEKTFPELDKLYIYKNMELLNDKILNELAWQWNVEFYSSELPKSKKIEMIQKSYLHHMKKGTTGSLESALKTIVKELEVHEWFKYSGTPYTFKLIVEGNSLTGEEINKVYKLVEIYKNARSTLDGFIVSKVDRANTKLSIAQNTHVHKITRFREEYV